VWLVMTAFAGFARAGDVLLGVLAPAAAACVTWKILERTVRSAPDQSTGTMIRLLMGKVVAIGAYMAVILKLRLASPVPFVASFAAAFVTLHVIQAIYLRRLFLSRV
jgi:hypothetical protein